MTDRKPKQTSELWTYRQNPTEDGRLGRTWHPYLVEGRASSLVAMIWDCADAEANAKLIAASRDLLLACRAFLDKKPEAKALIEAAVKKAEYSEPAVECKNCGATVNITTKGRQVTK